jgi:5'-methylthioadenosine phosphorylase
MTGGSHIGPAPVGIVGGSGLYAMDGMTDVEAVDVDTPFGKPSDSIVLGNLYGVPVAFLPRHGRGHRITPTDLPVRANIYALKKLGVERLISVSAVGSLKEDLRPLDMVVPDQLIDRTYRRASTFFEGGVVGHIAFAHPFCPHLSGLLNDAAVAAGVTTHMGGTCIVMEGPAFSTVAESNMYRSWGADIIGMTALPEAKLAREAEMCYATLACVTDYDVWHSTEEQVTVELVVANLMKNVAASQGALRRLLPTITAERPCDCGTALREAVITARDAIPAEARQKLHPIIGKYIEQGG